MIKRNWINRDAVTAAMLLDFDNRDLKNLFMHICGFSNDKGFCYPSNATLAKCCECSIRSIIRWTKKLVKMGRIEKQYRHNHSNLFKVILDKIVSSSGCHAVTSSGDCESHEKNSNRTFKTKNKQKPVCVEALNTEDQELALNENETSSAAVAPEKATIIAVIESTKPKPINCAQFCLTLQEYLNMFQYDKPAGYRIKRAFNRLSEDDKALIKELLPQYINETVWKSSGIQGKVYRCHPAKWLNEKRWTEIKPKRAPKPQPKPKQIDKVSIEQDLKNKALQEARIIEAKRYLLDHREELEKAVYDDCPGFMAGYKLMPEMLHKLMIDKALEVYE